jgi:hypothetical protein
MTPALLLLTLIGATPGDAGVVDAGTPLAVTADQRDAGAAVVADDGSNGGLVPPTTTPAPTTTTTTTTTVTTGPTAVATPTAAPPFIATGVALLPSFSVIVDELTTPVVFQIASGGKEPRRRAAEASAAFAAALRTQPVADTPPAQVVVVDGMALVKIRGRTVTALMNEDAIAAGATSLSAFAEELETRLVEFVDTHQARSSLQQLAFHVFFSVFLAVLAVLTLRGLNRAFARADSAIEDRAAAFKPLRLFDVALLSSDAVRGLIGTALVMGRVVSVIGVVVSATAGILAQFDRTRPLLESLAAAAGRPVLGGLETFVAAVPGLVLAGVLLVLLRGGLRFLQLLLDGVADGRVKNGVVPAARAPAARVALTGAVVLVAMPLIIGAAFGRFGTPLESLALGAGGAVLLGMVPMLASAVVGVTVLWRSTVKAGDWVEVDTVTGEVAAVGVTELVLVPAGGGTVVVPMLLLALRPLRRLGREPLVEHTLRVSHVGQTVAVIDRLVALARTVDPAGGAELIDVDKDTVLVRLFVPVGTSDGREALSRAVLKAVDLGTVTLAAGGR